MTGIESYAVKCFPAEVFEAAYPGSIHLFKTLSSMGFSPYDMALQLQHLDRGCTPSTPLPAL